MEYLQRQWSIADYGKCRTASFHRVFPTRGSVVSVGKTVVFAQVERAVGFRRHAFACVDVFVQVRSYLLCAVMIVVEYVAGADEARDNERETLA